MAGTIKQKRSAVAGKVPTTAQLDLGELAVNTTDGKLFMKKSVGGTDSIVEVGPVASVAGKTGAVTLAKGDVGLGNVDNTSDASKPVSTATQTALNAKADASRQIATGTGLTGGGNLSADRTIAADIATQAEAEAGTATAKLMTPQRVAQAIAALGAAANVQTFPTSGTWTKPANARLVLVRLWGAGGGGGSGEVNGSTTDRSGGQGGQGGVFLETFFDADQLPATVTVTVGAGGVGGNAKTTSGNGNAGSAGGASSFSILSAAGGVGGVGGGEEEQLPAVAPSAVVTAWSGASGGFTEDSSGVPGNSSYRAGGGGGSGGGGVYSSNVATTPGDGGKSNSFAASGGGGAAGSSSQSYANVTNGGNGTAFGMGGGGGGNMSSTYSLTSGAGGNGATAGGGGGGGARRTTSPVAPSGAGGNGGNGYVEVISW